jgi:hypothetical protein
MSARKPSRRQIAETNEYLLRRQQQFRLAAEYAAQAFAAVPGVEKVALFGSVARPLGDEVPRFREFRRVDVAVLHECKDVDLAVWLSDQGCVPAVRRARGQCVNDLLRERNVGVAHHQLDVFLLEHGTDRYRGRLCTFGTCPKDGKLECLVPGCGEIPFVRQHEDFVLVDDALRPDRVVVLHDSSTVPAAVT